MKRLFISITLLASISSFAAVENGKYQLTDIHCSGNPIKQDVKAGMLDRMDDDITVLNITANNVVLSSVDECSASRAIYAINDREHSTRMHFRSEKLVNFPDSCPNTVRMKDSSDLLIESVTSSKIEFFFSELKVNRNICNKNLVFVFEK